MWSFCQKKKDKQWVWLAIHRRTRQIVGLFIGDRSVSSARGLWESLPKNYRNAKKVYTDFWESYLKVIPEESHLPSEKGSGKTNLIERLVVFLCE